MVLLHNVRMQCIMEPHHDQATIACNMQNKPSQAARSGLLGAKIQL
jgi:hypothetical protein